MLRTAPTLAHASHGYSPILNFEIADIESVCKRATEEYKAELDGPIVEDEFMKVACLRTSCGLTLSIHQVLKQDTTEFDYEQLVKRDGGSVMEKDESLDAKT